MQLEFIFARISDYNDEKSEDNVCYGCNTNILFSDEQETE